MLLTSKKSSEFINFTTECVCVCVYNRGCTLNTYEVQIDNINEWSGLSGYCDETESSRMPQWAVISLCQAEFCIAGTGG